MLVSCAKELNNGTEDILYNGIVYERFRDLNYNFDISEEHATYVGDFIEIYAYGQELAWEVYSLNEEENLLYTAYTDWIRPGYVFPTEFGEDFASVEYVVSTGMNFLIIPDDYSEEVFPLRTFEGSVKLEDIVSSEPSPEITEYTTHNSIRFFYKNHADIRLMFDLCSADGKYYLDVRKEDRLPSLHEIKPEYVELLTSAIPDAN